MNSAKKGAIISAVVSSIACIGDTILYSVLPVYADSLGITDIWLGLFLSINRFVRIFAHGLVAYLIMRFGLKRIVISSSIIASQSTFFYQFPQHFPLFAMVRIFWGIAYSGLRQTTLRYASLVDKKREEAFALTQFIKSIGPFTILLVGPLLFAQLGYHHSFFLVFVMTTLGIAVAFYCLPELPKHEEPLNYRKVITLSSFNILLFLVSFITDGLLVVILYLLFHNENTSKAILLVNVSLFLLIRRLISSLLPLVLLKSYKAFSIRTHFISGLILTTASLVLLHMQIVEIALILSFIGSTLIVTTAPIEAIKTEPLKSNAEIITAFAFWWDLGKAFGALIGIKIYKTLGVDFTWSILVMILILLSLKYYRRPVNNIV